ncbi:ATP-binding protein [Pseudocolwellia sp. AS88]|uniref:ATP-binding protein n=1 Tax=Pseudocolwellia sp. AS88 TaxID=3063958 RepID=UPI0026F11938|nr:ATP-binding protein [Pseudocolwellia sp. AS88]MDO7085920.1 ATP-binding protein [Pseudocolwellia sp. AS88]
MMKLKSFKFSERSIKAQVVTFIVIAITVMIFVISLVTSSWINQQYRHLMLTNAMQLTEGLAKQAVFSVLSGSEQNAQEAMEQVQGFESVSAARILLENYEPFISRGEFPVSVQVEHTHWLTTQVSIETEEHWFIISPITVRLSLAENDNSSESGTNHVSHEVIGYAEVLYSKAPLTEAQNQVTLLIASIGLISIVFFSVFLHLGLVKLFIPLRNLSTTMQLAETTKEYVFAEDTGAQEIKNMANSFNNMMKVLQKQGNDIKLHRDRLESEVKERTTELVDARDAAIKASRHKSEFIANISHELRTPIQSIIGYGELVTEELEQEGKIELINDMDRIANNSQRLLSMINSLLDLAKVESGKIDVNLTEVNIERLILIVRDTISPLASKNNNQFSIIQKQTISLFPTDKEKLEQVLINLLGNACKFTQNGEIRFTVESTDSSIKFIVSDTGIGLSKEQQSYIFEEFRQVDASQSRKFSGTGLGLAISKVFIELIGGTITVESQLGSGSMFVVTLPIHRDNQFS